jgi:type IV fimbrial biogenesis protein FimT
MLEVNTMRHSRRRSLGFTLIEVMVTLAIGAVVMMVAAPSFLEYRRNSELSDAVGNLILAAGSAKATALKTGRNTFVQVNDTSLGWRSGWFVFVDNNWNNTYNEGTDDVVIRHDALASTITATAATSTTFADGYLMFSGAGFPRTKTSGALGGNGVVTLATANRSTNVIVDTTGRARSCKSGTTGCTSL